MQRLCFTLVLTGCAWAQSPAFDAASIKPNGSGDGHSSWHSRTGYLVVKNQSLQSLIGVAYGVPHDQVTGGPKWLDRDRYDIEARAAGPAHDPELLRMLQTLLGERFHLAAHRETRSAEGVVLTVDRGGLKIHSGATWR